MNAPAELPLSPAWKEAVRRLIDAGLTYGQIVTRNELITLCEIKRPGKIASVEAFHNFEITVMQAIYHIKEALLEKHCMLLQTQHNGSYLVIAPGDQTRHAISAGIKALRKEMIRMSRGVSYVRHDLLTQEQRQQNTDAISKISHLRKLNRPAHKQLKSLLGIDDE